VTPAPLPKAIRIQSIRDDVTYELPVRPLGRVRWLALFPIGIGLPFMLFPAAALIHFLGEATGGAMNWLFAVFMAPFICAGFVPLALGLFLVGGRCRVEWREKQLSTLEHFGLLRWRRRLPKAPIRKLTVGVGKAEVNNKAVTTGPLASLAALTAEFARGKPRLVAIGYPRDWLQALAEHLSARVTAGTYGATAPAVEVVTANESERAKDEAFVAKPPGSPVQLEPVDDGLRVIVPPEGLWKGSKGLFFFGLLWCAFMAVFTTIAVKGEWEGGKGAGLPVWLFVAGFWAIGIGLLAAAAHLGKRQAMLCVSGGRLSVDQRGLFGAKHREWQRDDIAAIRADASNMEVNDRPLTEIQIHPVVGKKVGLLAGRCEDELRWIASELRRALGVPAAAKESPAQSASP